MPRRIAWCTQETRLARAHNPKIPSKSGIAISATLAEQDPQMRSRVGIISERTGTSWVYYEGRDHSDLEEVSC